MHIETTIDVWSPDSEGPCWRLGNIWHLWLWLGTSIPHCIYATFHSSPQAIPRGNKHVYAISFFKKKFPSIPHFFAYYPLSSPHPSSLKEQPSHCCLRKRRRFDGGISLKLNMAKNDSPCVPSSWIPLNPGPGPALLKLKHWVCLTHFLQVHAGHFFPFLAWNYLLGTLLSSFSV